MDLNEKVGLDDRGSYPSRCRAGRTGLAIQPTFYSMTLVAIVLEKLRLLWRKETNTFFLHLKIAKQNISM
jgi:hypothetical protein